MTVRLRRRRRVCSGCGQTGRQLQIHGRRVKRWRHLDLGASRCVIECELRRLRCPACGSSWSRCRGRGPAPHHTRDFEDVVAWLAQQMAKTPITGLLRIGWDTVGRIVARVVADQLDERAPRRPGRDRLRRDQLPPRPALPHLGRRPSSGRDRVVRRGPQRRDIAGVLRRARRPQAVDPGGLDRHERRLREGDPRQRPRRRDLLRPVSRRPPRPARRRSGPPRRVERPRPLAHQDRQVDQGHPLVAAQEPRQADDPPARRCSARSPQANQAMFRAFLLKEELRLLYHLEDPALAPAHLDAWLAWASRSRLAPFVRLARTIRRHRAGILAAIRLGLSNGRLDRGHRRPRRHGDR